MNKQVLITVSYIAEIEEDLMTGKRDREKREIFNEFDRRIPQEIVIKNKFKAEWERTSRVLLDKRFNNCERCSKCGTWVSDTNMPNYLVGLRRCKYINGNNYCDECADEVQRK